MLLIARTIVAAAMQTKRKNIAAKYGREWTVAAAATLVTVGQHENSKSKRCTCRGSQHRLDAGADCRLLSSVTAKLGDRSP